ncbi:MAG: four helix bundle protein [Bacteroidetes bacterium]|nr:four helix bundle protein [Bacteroidota bacterium]
MQNYKDLKVWEKAHHFTLLVYETTKLFPKEELYSLTNQIRRSASSIPANIAEGCGKNSQLDFANFLNIALGSANETEYYIILSKDLKYLDFENFESLVKLINEIKATLIALIAKIRMSS